MVLKKHKKLQISSEWNENVRKLKKNDRKNIGQNFDVKFHEFSDLIGNNKIRFIGVDSFVK